MDILIQKKMCQSILLHNCIIISITIILCNETCGHGIEFTDTPYAVTHYKNQYGDDYGKKWIYFPDGDGVPHLVNLTITSHQIEPQSILRKEYVSDVEYRLYASGNKDNYTIFKDNGEAVLEGNYSLTLNDKPIKIITHGWKSTVDLTGVEDIKNAYLKEQDVYVITADWSYIADSIFYNWVANETKTIGMQIAQFLDGIHDLYNVTGDKIHLIGHSLGAHVMGVAAFNSKLTIDRITGLDPARPLFEYPSKEDSDKLDRTDAKFVDIIHTCGGVLGIESAIGAADYFPNNGTAPQPGCESMQHIFEACSHGRAFAYFTESIRYPKAFPAYKCENWLAYLEKRCYQHGFMGEHASSETSGILHLKTKNRPPYGRGVYIDV